MYLVPTIFFTSTSNVFSLIFKGLEESFEQASISSRVNWLDKIGYLTQKNNLPKIGECTISIIGLGYVGLPLALVIAKTKKIIGKNISNNEKTRKFRY